MGLTSDKRLHSKYTLHFPRTELSLLEPLAVWKPPAPKPPQERLGPRCKGKAGAELRPGRCQWRLPTSCRLLLPGQESRSQASLGKARPRQSSLAQGTLPDQGSQWSWSSAILEAHSAPPQQGLQQQATGLPPLPRRRLPSTCPVHSASRRSHTSPPAGLGSGVTSPELGLWAGTQTRRGRPKQPAHSSAGEKSIREPMYFRQMMGDHK